MAVRMWDLGNVLARVEQIKNARYQRDPSNPQNQLNMLRIQQAQAELDSPESADQWGYDTIPAYDAEGNLQLYRASRGGDIAPVQFPEGVNPAIPGSYKDLGGALRFLSNYGGVNPQPTTQGQPVTAQTPAEIPKTYAPGQSPEEKAAAARAVEEAKAAAERQSPETQARQQAEKTEALEAIGTIEALLGKDEKGRMVLEYAYGKANLAPDFVKPQNWIDAEAQRDRVVAILNLAQVGKLKGTGPITENEQIMLRKAASSLSNPLISPKLAAEEMRRVLNLLATKAKQYDPEKDESEEDEFVDWNSLQ